MAAQGPAQVGRAGTLRDVEALVGVAEVRELLAARGRTVSRQRVDALTRTAWWPAPVAELRAGRIWRLREVEAALDAHSPEIDAQPE